MIKIIQLANGESLYVEVDDDREQFPIASEEGSGNDLPKGSRNTAAGGLERSAAAAADMLKSQIRSLATLSLSAIEDLKPSEVHIEAHIKFAGDVNLIPFIASANGEGGIKISLTWRNNK